MNSKNPRNREDMGGDVISGLADDVLINILSRLSTKEAVRTSILSSRWKNPWKWIYNLDFRIDSEEYEQRAPIYIHVLELLQSPNIRSISLVAKAPYSVNAADFDEYVGKWVAFAVAHNVSELYLDLYGEWEEDRITVPQSVFTCASLVKLTLKSDWRFHFDIPDASVCFPSVKSLDIIFVIGEDSDVHKLRRLFHRCPVLEDLSINTVTLFMGNVVIFELILPALKRLRIYENRDEELQFNAPNTYVVTAPELEHLDVSTEHTFPYFKLGYVPYLDKVSLHAEMCYLKEFLSNFDRKKTVEVLEGLWYTKCLSIRQDAVEVLRFAVGLNCKMLEFPHLVELQIESLYRWKFLQQLLTKSPALKVLKLSLDDDFMNADDQGIVWSEDLDLENIGWFQFGKVPPCLSSSIKRIQFDHMVGKIGELAAIKYLLEHGEGLEKFLIQNDISESNKAEKFEKLITDFNRSSTLCEIEFLQ